jgi:pectinesterase
MRRFTPVFAALICGGTLLCVAHAFAEYDFIVAKDGSGNFSTIQEAVTACRDYSERDYTIFVKKGVYEEKLVIPSWKQRITIIGERVDSTIVTYGDYAAKLDSGGKKLGTFKTHTCLISGTDITFENITFINSAGQVGQAVAVHVEGDRCVFRNCRIIGNQDTLLGAGERSRQFFVRCHIEGTTDFIFGPSTAVFDHCTIVSKKDSYITAASTVATQKFGFVFLNCELLADTCATKVYLGRPWRLYAFTTFINCVLGKHIVPEGWHNWSKPEAELTARYSEYKSVGPGASPATRVPWSRQLSKEEAEGITPKAVLAGDDGWNPAR